MILVDKSTDLRYNYCECDYIFFHSYSVKKLR